MLGSAIRWMSPELFSPENFGLKESSPTKESDYYALGMVIYEVLSGQVPFAPLREVVVISKILEHKRPTRPLGDEGRWFTDSIWKIMEGCWQPQPNDRLNAEAVLRGLEGKPFMPRSTPPNADGGAEPGDTDGQSDTIARDPTIFPPLDPKLTFMCPRGITGLPVAAGAGGSRERWAGNGLARNIRKIVKAAAKKVNGLSQTR